MSTGIQWTDETWNPIVGCTKVSQGCKNCYAKTVHDNRHKALLAGKAMPEQYREPFETVQLMPERLTKPLHWRKPRKVFVNSVSDLFHEDVPDEYLNQLFAVMALTPRHTYQILTKRPERMREYINGQHIKLPVLFPEPHRGFNRGSFVLWAAQKMAEAGKLPKGMPYPWSEEFTGPGEPLEWPLPNVWLGVSTEDQATADERIPLLLQTPAAVRFISAEPLLGPIELTEMVLDERLREKHPNDPIMRFNAFTGLMTGMDEYIFGRAGLDWVIVGGESGGGARPCDIGWIRSIVEQCKAAGVPVFVKQLGSKPCIGGVESEPGSNVFEPDYVQLHHSHGGDPDEWPADLCVREFPTTPTN